MEFNWSIVGWIAGLLFVYIFGLYEGRGQGYKRRKKEEEQEKKDLPPPVPETVTVTVDDPGLLRIKNENGSFVLDLDGARVNPVSLLPGQRKRLIEVLNIMRPWLEGRPAPQQRVPSPSTSSDQSTPLAQTHNLPVPSREAKPAPVSMAPLSQPPSQPIQTAQSRPAAGKPAVIPPEDRPASPANSIVTQIDTILQTRLAGTPLEERGIFLTQSPQGGVMVYVGLTRYNGVDEVPDPEIKAAIRAAIAEWEDKYTPGLQK